MGDQGDQPWDRPGARRARTALALVVAVLLAAGLAALVVVDDEADGDGGESVPIGHALVRGSVVDAESGRGIEGATVQVDHTGGPVSVRTDGQGHYRVVVDMSRPVALTADAAGHRGVVAFAKLCDGERRDVRLELPPARPGSPPPAPMVLSGPCG